MALVLTQTSTPVPLRLAKRILAGIIITSSAYVASATINTGLQFGYEKGVESALSRIASVSVTKRALAEEAPKLIASTQAVTKKEAPYFAMPAEGKDWGEIHANNGVDIANTCGTPVVAAAGGAVIEVNSGWNGGYGNAVMIKHGNGSRTYYAHLQDISVQVGSVVEKKDMVGTIGITGKATGCHLHFEVHGGTNPFGK